MLKRFFNSKAFVTLVWVLGLLILWEIAAYVIAEVNKNPMADVTLPYVHNIFSIMFENAEKLFKACFTTFIRAMNGFVIGALVGIFLAVLMSLFKWAEKTAFPYLLILQMIPILGLAPIIWCIVKDFNVARTVISALITFYPVATNTLAGFKSVDKDKRDLMFCYAAKKTEVYKKLMFPSALPYIFSGLKIAAPMAVTAATIVDTFGTTEGIGYIITSALYGGGKGIFWASIFSSAIMGIISYYIIVLIEKYSLPWKRNRKNKAVNTDEEK